MLFLLMACNAEMTISDKASYDGESDDTAEMGDSNELPTDDEFLLEASWVKPRFTITLALSSDGSLIYSEVNSEWTVLDQHTEPICKSDREFQISELVPLADARVWLNLQRNDQAEHDSECSFSFADSFELGGVGLMYESLASWGAIDWESEELDPESDNVYSGLIRFPDREEAFLFGVAGVELLPEWNPQIEDASILADVHSIEQWSFFSAFALPLQQ